MVSPVAEAIRNIIEAHKDGIDAGYELQQRKINTIVAAYEKALDDPATKIPTYLHAAIEASRGEPTNEVAMTTTRRGVSMTEYRLVGTLEGVQCGIKSIFDTYPAQGYGTRVNSLELNGDRNYDARMSRSNSCD